MCSHHELGKGCVIPESIFEGIPATKVCHPLKHKCLGVRKVEYILHDEDGPKIVTMLLLLSGDVEKNPGPGNHLHSMLHVGLFCSNLSVGRTLDFILMEPGMQKCYFGSAWVGP